MAQVCVIQGDITTLKVDAIVNAANEYLQHGGGVASAISRAAGPELQAESDQLAPVPTGAAKATRGYNLKAKWVIHAVGPRWSGGQDQEAQLLESAYRSAIQVAAELGAKTLAFPSISTAIFGFPIDLAAPIAIRAITDEASKHPTLLEVTMCTFSDHDFEIYERALHDS
jgi:O-acetyl-ADP-ribose deacetylase (regulator of RNase III)